MTRNGGEIDWWVNCEQILDINTALESPDSVRSEAENIINEIEREQGVELEIVESGDEVEMAPGGAATPVMDFVVQVAAGVSTALIVDMLRERSETDYVEASDDG